MNQNNKCVFCGEPAATVYSYGNETVCLCNKHKGMINQMDDNTKKEIKQDIEKVLRERQQLRENIDHKHLTQYENILRFDLKPFDICNQLDKYIIGQNEAKKKISVAVRRHYKRISLRIIEESGGYKNQIPKEITANNIPKENILLIGPTGCGKTYTCRVLSEIVGVPFWAASMTGFTEDGYVGDSVENLISSLLREAGYLNPLAECGMMFMDEIDKKANKATGNPSITRDVSGEGVQTAILDMIDTHGSIMNVGLTLGNRKHSQRYTEKFNTRDVLFILGGAFSGLTDIVRKRVKRRKTIGFNVDNAVITIADKQKDNNELLHQVLPEDIVEYGFLPELVGRLGLIAVLDPLSKENLKDILLNVENAIIKQQENMAALEDFEIEFTEEALDSIVDKAVGSGMGARRLRAIVTDTTEQIFFDLPKSKARVLAETVEDPSKYEVV